MLYYPDFETFCDLARDFRLVPVCRRLVSDALTPVSAFRKIDTGGTACLFESVIGGEKVGRYSFLAAQPFLQLTAKDNRVKIVSAGGSEEFDCDDPLEELRRRVSQMRAAHWPELPPFTGGAVGYAGYDVVRYTENLPHAPRDDRDLPDMSFAFYDHMLVFDNVNKTIVVVALAQLTDDPSDREAAYRDAQRRVDSLVDQLAAPGRELTPVDIEIGGAPEIAYTSNFQPGRFRAGGSRLRGIHPGRRHFSGRDQPAAAGGDPVRSDRDLPFTAGRQPQPFHVLPADARSHPGGQFARDHGPRGRRQSDGASFGRHAGRGVPPRPRTGGWRRNCWPTRKNEPNT